MRRPVLHKRDGVLSARLLLALLEQCNPDPSNDRGDARLVPLHGDPQALLALALDVLLQRVVGVCAVAAGVVTVAAGPRGARDGGPILLKVGGDSLLAATVASATALKMAGRATVAVLTKRMAEP